MSEEPYEHGSMDVSERERIFSAFLRWVAWAFVIILIALAFLALTQT